MNPLHLAPNITLIRGDCLEYMATLPDGAYSLAVVDAPYGVDIGNAAQGKWVTSRMPKKDWDKQIPTPEYFSELARVAERQIIWGGNYYQLRPSRGFLIWDKGKGFYGRDFAECEMAWLSMDCNAKIFKHDPLANGDYRGKIHPTQKPVSLYRFILQNYARPGDTIPDTHLGSGSSAIAAWEMGYTFTGIEIDRDYFDAAVERIRKRMSQPYLPGIVQPKPEQTSLF